MFRRAIQAHRDSICLSLILISSGIMYMNLSVIARFMQGEGGCSELPDVVLCRPCHLIQGLGMQVVPDSGCNDAE